MARSLFGAIIGSCLMCAMNPSVAQTADPDSETPGLQEIIVTAQKRAENVNTIPISISVLTNKDIVQAGVESTQELELATPGLVFGNTNGFAQPYIRGIGTDLISPGQESPVGFYLDGVYLPFTTSLLQEFGDISRIEVLKGPQGTLYGRNTTGGAINIITRDPDQTFTADASVTAGNLGFGKAVAYVAGGITNDLSANLSGVYTLHNGFFNVLNTGEHADNLEQFGLRTKIKYDVNDNWQVLFGGDYVHKNDSSDSVFTTLIPSDVPLPAGVGPASRPRNTYADLDPPPYRTATDFGTNLTVRGHIGWADFTSITGFREDYLDSTADGDETALPLLAYQSSEGEQEFTQEFHLVSTGDSPLQWIAGLYFLKANAFFGPVDVWAGVPNTEPPNAGLLDGRTRISSYAVYGQASYALPYGFKLIAGLRTSYEQRKLTGQTNFTADLLDPAVRAALGLGPIDPEKSWTSTKPKATLQWENPGQLLYASYSTGFKAGSYNLISVTSPGPLQPEDIKAYELGGKHDLALLNHGHVDWSVFYYKYNNIQVNIQDPGVGGIVAAQNAASSINRGIDLDLAVPIVRNLTASVGAEYLDARYESFPDASVSNIIDGELGTITPIGATKSVNASGNRAERSPLLTTTVQLAWLLPVGPGHVTTTATVYHNSGFYFDAGDEVQQRHYNQANLNIQYAPQDNRWTVSAWINNAFNATVIAGIASSPYAVGADYTDPRLFGLGASVHF